jgi:hypothetical protein
MSPTCVVIHSGAGGRGAVDALERRCWSEGGGSIVIPRLHRWDAVDLSPRQHVNIPSRRATTTCALRLHCAYSLTHKNLFSKGASFASGHASWRPNISSNMCLGGVGVVRWLLTVVSARNPRDVSVFSIL